jgi:hypothetical protein
MSGFGQYILRAITLAQLLELIVRSSVHIKHEFLKFLMADDYLVDEALRISEASTELDAS